MVRSIRGKATNIMRYVTPRGLAFGLCAVILGGGTAACTSKKAATPDAAVSAFLAGWQAKGFPSSLAIVDSNGATVSGATVSADIAKLSGDLASIKPTFKPAKAAVNKAEATDLITISWALSPTTTWSYQTTLRLNQKDGKWRPIWSASVVQPKLTEGNSLRLDLVNAPRGEVRDGDGQAIVTARPVVTVGVVKKDVTDANSLAASLKSAFDSVGVDVDLTGLPDQIKSAGDNEFIEVVTLRRDAYDQIRSQIHDLAGTSFREGTLELAPTRVFAHALLGTVSDVTKERMDKNPGKYHVGDQVGFGGVEEQYDDLLRGTDGLSVLIPGKGQTSSGTDIPDTQLFHVDPVAGKSVTTTLDQKTQNAADQALVGQPKPAAVVAMRISDGKILAVANGPDATGLDLAMTAQVPPGSTFKTVTATNVLESGKLTPASDVACPQTLNVGGRVFTNYEGEAFGKTTLQVDFAKSCNTAFASLAPQLGGPDGLTKTAAQLGVGGKWSTGVATFTGSVPADGNNIDQAAAAFGQGKTLVSPVAMLGVAGAVARGHWIAPIVVTDPAITGNDGPGQALKDSTVAGMKQMMRAVITNGTGAKVLNVPGEPIFGKTGTAEFDSDPTHAHSWFIGYQGDLALAVFVNNGGVSTAGAVPIAKKFLDALH
jgi:cell division protein FtsI/penicillin-binding protein 2